MLPQEHSAINRAREHADRGGGAGGRSPPRVCGGGTPPTWARRGELTRNARAVARRRRPGLSRPHQPLGNQRHAAARAREQPSLRNCIKL